MSNSGRLGPSSSEATRTVVVVEDDMATRDSIAVLLEVRGFSVHTYPSMDILLRAVDHHDGACLIVDGEVDGVSCFAILDALRARGVRWQTILFTGLPEMALSQRASAYDEVVAMLRKPLGGDALVDAVRQAFTDH